MSIGSSNNSSENLTSDERLILESGIRKEPQGEESKITDRSLNYDHYTNKSVVHNGVNVIDQKQQAKNFQNYQQQQLNCCANNHYHHYHQNQNNTYYNAINSNCYPLYENSNFSDTSSCITEDSYKKNYKTVLEIPRHHSNSISQSQVNKNKIQRYTLNNQINKNQRYDLHYANLPPPPVYNKENYKNYFTNDTRSNMLNNSNSNSFLLESQSSNGSRSCSTTPDFKSNESISVLSKSNPDLAKLETELSCFNIKDDFSLNKKLNQNCQIDKLQTNQLDSLRIENAYLKEKLESFVKKISKLQKFELEIQKVHQMYEELMLSSDKKEKLERAARYKLEIEIKRLQQQNKLLRDQLTNALTANLSKEDKENELKKEDNQKTDLLFGQLVAQNKELLNSKERQEIELQAQRSTLEEQRNHIEILDSALMNAQNNVVSLENNLRKKIGCEERANNLQKALTNLQLSSERRLEIEKRARACLEKEIEMLKLNQKQANGSNVVIKQSETELENLKKLTREYEEKIINLESEVSNWEQKYLEESTMRQIEVNAASVPKDAKIAALEKTSQQTEKLIAEARSERLRHMDELHEASKKTTELESSIKDLESKLAEKDAMIKVLQKHSLDRDNVLQQSILAQRSNLGKHTRSVSSMGLINPSSQTTSNLKSRNINNFSISNCQNNNSSVNRFTDLSSNSTRTSGYSTSSNNSPSTSSLNEVKNNSLLEDQLKEFDKRLTNKTSIIRALKTEKEKYPDRYFKI